MEARDFAAHRDGHDTCPELRLRLELGENGVVTIVPIRPVAVTAGTVDVGPGTYKIL